MTENSRTSLEARKEFLVAIKAGNVARVRDRLMTARDRFLGRVLLVE